MSKKTVGKARSGGAKANHSDSQADNDVEDSDVTDGTDHSSLAASESDHGLSALSTTAPTHAASRFGIGRIADICFELFFFASLVAYMLIQHFNTCFWHLYKYNVPQITFTALLLTKRITWKFIQDSWVDAWERKTVTVKLAFQIALLMIPLASLTRSTQELLWQHELRTLVFLVYPVVLYYSLFGTILDHRRVHVLPSQTRYSPDAVLLSFRYYMAHIMYTATEAAYYTAVLPLRLLRFDNSAYDLPRCLAIGFYVFLNTALLLCIHLFDSRAEELLKQAKTVGCWQFHRRAAGAQTWSKAETWDQHSVVRHKKRIFVAVGEKNKAEPGNWEAWRFYHTFRYPARALSVLVCVQSFVVASLLGWLLICRHWQFVAAWGTVTAFNLGTLIYATRVRRKMLHLDPTKRHRASTATS